MRDDKQVGKAYVWPNGLITNLYIVKKFRGDISIFNELMVGIKENFKDLPLFLYAVPKQGKDKKDALKRLYARHGFVNVSGDKMILNGDTETDRSEGQSNESD